MGGSLDYKTTLTVHSGINYGKMEIYIERLGYWLGVENLELAEKVRVILEEIAREGRELA